MKKFITAIIAAAMILSAEAQWVSPGNGTTYTFDNLSSVSNGAVVKTSDGNFNVVEDITISAGDFLNFDATLETVTFNDGIQLTIAGGVTSADRLDKALLTGGNGHFKVKFDASSETNVVKNINFQNGGGIRVSETPSIIFENCEFGYFNKSFTSYALLYFNCSPVVESCYFHDNQGAAIGSGANIFGAPKIYNSYFYNNVTENSNNPQLNLGPCSDGDTIKIIGNTIEGFNGTMVGGIAIANLMNVGNTKAQIFNNNVFNNRYGYTQTGPTIESWIYDNLFIDNNLETNPMNGGSGISIYGTATTNIATLRRNIITGNLWGITAIYYHNIDMGTVDDFGENVIYNNGNGGVTYALYNNAFSDMTAIGNYWGSNDPDFAAEVIYDHSDDPSLGTVTYLPIMEMYPIGDANSDGEVNVQDIQAIISYMLDGTGINFDSADANSDGYVNILDIVLIVNIIENF